MKILRKQNKLKKRKEQQINDIDDIKIDENFDEIFKDIKQELDSDSLEEFKKEKFPDKMEKENEENIKKSKYNQIYLNNKKN